VSAPELSVVICTYNRRALVERAVRSLMTQTRSPASFEVILVDNNSSDDTLAWAEAFSREFPQLRPVHERRQGLSFARNRGALEASAPILAFLDDDAVAVPGWVDAMLKAFSSGRPRTVAVGGRIELEWAKPRPTWLPDSARGWLGYFTLPEDCRDLRPGKDNLRGGNMAVERAALLDVGSFDTRLGRSKSGLMGNEEVEFQRRLEQLGRPMAYSHDALIYHLVHPERLTARWMFRRAYDQGRSDVHLAEAMALSQSSAGFVRPASNALYNGTRALLAPRTSRRIHFALRATSAVGAVVEGARRRGAAPEG
jgi:glycosyltransferase involved in cell wall biosynthesis